MRSILSYLVLFSRLGLVWFGSEAFGSVLFGIGSVFYLGRVGSVQGPLENSIFVVLFLACEGLHSNMR